MFRLFSTSSPFPLMLWIVTDSRKERPEASIPHRVGERFSSKRGSLGVPCLMYQRVHWHFGGFGGRRFCTSTPRTKTSWINDLKDRRLGTHPCCAEARMVQTNAQRQAKYTLERVPNAQCWCCEH